jgi:hypothetical protein
MHTPAAQACDAGPIEVSEATHSSSGRIPFVVARITARKRPPPSKGSASGVQYLLEACEHTLSLLDSLDG